MAEDPNDWDIETKSVRGGMARSPYGEISEALFLTQSFAYESAQAQVETGRLDLVIFEGRVSRDRVVGDQGFDGLAGQDARALDVAHGRPRLSGERGSGK